MTKYEAVKKLTALRDQLALRTGVENYKVLKYETIDLIASTLPKTLDELKDIKGIGDKKLAQFGKLILEAINDGSVPAKISFFAPAETTRRGSLPPLEQAKPRQSPLRETLPERNDTSPAILSVSEYLDQVNDVLGDNLSDLLVQGEISGLSDHPTGVYFSLKDEEDESVLSCYLPRALYYRLGVILDDGLKVKLSGQPNIWKAKGRFSLKVSTLELVGEGSLKQAYEKLKLKLEGEGLFARKRELPEFISRIGVITSKTGAVINDFRNNLANLGFEIQFFDSRVEGAYAVEEIRRGIKWFNEKEEEMDVLVLIRGGGSLEDLQAFNNELLVRDLFASKIPTIAGIGHDRDVPIASLIADTAVSTPTAVAQLINHSWDPLVRDLPMKERNLLNLFERSLEGQKSQAARLTERMLSRLQTIIGRFGVMESALKGVLYSVGNRIQSLISKVGDYERILLTASPERNLKLGYSIVSTTDGQIVRSITQLKTGEPIKNRFADGAVESTINKIIE